MAQDVLKQFNWYHGAIGRDKAQDLLEGKQSGVFLVRRRKDNQAEYVLSVSEKERISHYIILDVNAMYFKIGELRFADIASIIEFYKKHTLDSTVLTQPIIKSGHEDQLPNKNRINSLKVRAKFDFQAKDPEDLSFRKGDILSVIRKEEEKWWLARDNMGREGMVPVPYVEVIKKVSLSDRPKTDTIRRKKSQREQTKKHVENHPSIPVGHVGPVFAVAVQDREPNFYDQSLLGFKKGERIEVLEPHDDGSWEGRNLSTGKTGFFPFTHIKVITDN